MLTIDQIDVLGNALVPLFQYLEHEVIVDIARRIDNTMTYTRTAELMAMDMQRLGYSPAKIRAEAMKVLKADKEYQRAVEQNTLEYKKAVEEIIKDIAVKAAAEGNEIVAAAGDMSWVNDMSVWESNGKKLTDNSFLKQLKEGIAKQTVNEMTDLTRTTGFKTMSGMESIRNAYRNELDKAVIKICSGTFSRQKVIEDVIHNLAKSGIRTIDFASGRSMQLDTAVKLAIRTACNQISAKIEDENILKSGENLVYVSKHWGARNEGTGVANHEEWQGKVYFIKPGENYTEEAKRIGQAEIKDLWEETGYSVDGSHANNPLGMHGYNCRHRHGVFFKGISSIPDEEDEPGLFKINGKEYNYYQMTQKLRSMEREIRALKREREAREKLGLPNTETKKKVKQKIREYEEFCKKHKLAEQRENLNYQSGTSDITKTKAYKEYKRQIASIESKTNKEIGQEHEEMPRKATKGNYGVNWPRVQSEEFRNSISKLSTSEKTIDAIETRAKWALSNRDGKNTEELYAIDLDKGEEVAKIIDQNNPKAVHRTKSFTKKLNDVDALGRKILLLHNHPSDLPPSLFDVNALLKNRNVVGITVGHGGSIYYYSKPKVEIPEFDYRVAMKHFKEYTEARAMEKTMELLSSKYGFEFRKL